MVTLINLKKSKYRLIAQLVSAWYDTSESLNIEIIGSCYLYPSVTSYKMNVEYMPLKAKRQTIDMVIFIN